MFLFVVLILNWGSKIPNSFMNTINELVLELVKKHAQCYPCLKTLKNMNLTFCFCMGKFARGIRESFKWYERTRSRIISPFFKGTPFRKESFLVLHWLTYFLDFFSKNVSKSGYYKSKRIFWGMDEWKEMVAWREKRPSSTVIIIKTAGG